MAKPTACNIIDNDENRDYLLDGFNSVIPDCSDEQLRELVNVVQRWLSNLLHVDDQLIAAAPELREALRKLMHVGRTAIDARPDLDWNDLCALLARSDGKDRRL